MLIFKRKYSTHVQRNAAYFTIFCFIFVIAVGAILSQLFPEFNEVKVNEELFGRFFVNGHLAILGSIIFLIVLGKILAKQGYIAYSINEIGKNEAEEFNSRYQANFSFAKNKTGDILILLLSTAIPVIVVVGPHLIYPDLSQTITFLLLGIGFMLICGVFYGRVRKMMKGGNKAMIEVFQHANDIIPDTSIQLNGQDLDYSVGRLAVAMALKISGVFKGREFTAKYQVSGARYSGSSSQGSIDLKVRGLAKLNFTISENAANLTKFKGNTLDECFNKRFTMKGIAAEKLPEAFKKKLLESFRTISLKVKDGFISQSLANVIIPPFYSGQGLILFLDFMIELNEDLEA